MLTIEYYYDNGKNYYWDYKELGIASLIIKNDFIECPQIEKAVIYDEENNKILELKNEPIVLIGG